MDETFSQDIFNACRATEKITSEDLVDDEITNATAETANYFIGVIENLPDEGKEAFNQFFAQESALGLKEEREEVMNDLLSEFSTSEELEEYLENTHSIGYMKRYEEIKDYLQDIDWDYVYKNSIGMKLHAS
tara:strand:+ start:206 stop:601 length:396 start_codon:yes stop_codon:yes gene_type:complete